MLSTVLKHCPHIVQKSLGGGGDGLSAFIHIKRDYYCAYPDEQFGPLFTHYPPPPPSPHIFTYHHGVVKAFKNSLETAEN